MTAFASGSVSFGLHAIEGLGGAAQARVLVDQAIAAEAAGFDGVTMSEHHGDFPGYLGQPLLVATWILGATRRLWAGPSPYLLNLRNPALVAEELAWSHAAFPGRFAAAIAPGYAQADYDLLGVGAAFDDRADRFAAALRELLDTLAGSQGDEADAAVAAWATDPGTLLMAANSTAGARRAARHGLGVLLPGGNIHERYRAHIDGYREAGGPGPIVKIRQIWMGDPPAGALEARDAVYKAAASKDMRQANGFAEPFLSGSDETILEGLMRDAEVLGIDAINLRFHLAGMTHENVLDQLARFGAGVLPRLEVGMRSNC
jgi:alkanesulfonate monooxygenase SsuD/methylene tetrahydromethanopterin reductase-like flavin-dependent oxidoreductase (luciferase family)